MCTAAGIQLKGHVVVFLLYFYDLKISKNGYCPNFHLSMICLWRIVFDLCVYFFILHWSIRLFLLYCLFVLCVCLKHDLRCDNDLYNW